MLLCGVETNLQTIEIYLPNKGSGTFFNQSMQPQTQDKKQGGFREDHGVFQKNTEAVDAGGTNLRREVVPTAPSPAARPETSASAFPGSFSG